MRRIFCVSVVSGCAALAFAVAPVAAQASTTVSKSCTRAGLTTGLSCTTPGVTCPVATDPDFNVCDFETTVAVLGGLNGGAGGTATEGGFYSGNGSGEIPWSEGPTSCHAVNVVGVGSRCSATTPAFEAYGTDGYGGYTSNGIGRCTWAGRAISLIDRVTCTIKMTVTLISGTT